MQFHFNKLEVEISNLHSAVPSQKARNCCFIMSEGAPGSVSYESVPPSGSGWCGSKDLDLVQTAPEGTERCQGWILQWSGLSCFLDRLLCQGCGCYCYYSCCCCRYRCWRTTEQRQGYMQVILNTVLLLCIFVNGSHVIQKLPPTKFQGSGVDRWAICGGTELQDSISVQQALGWWSVYGSTLKSQR